MCAATATHRRQLWPVKFALEGTVASEVGVPGLPHISYGPWNSFSKGLWHWRLVFLVFHISAMAREIRSRRDCGIGGWCSWSSTYQLWPVKFALEGTVALEVGVPGLSHIPIGRGPMEYGSARGLLGEETGSACPVPGFWTWDAKHVAINVTNEKCMSFLAILKLLHVCICNRFENTPIFCHENRL
jgi:hypothetical protein